MVGLGLESSGEGVCLTEPLISECREDMMDHDWLMGVSGGVGAKWAPAEWERPEDWLQHPRDQLQLPADTLTSS